MIFSHKTPVSQPIPRPGLPLGQKPFSFRVCGMGGKRRRRKRMFSSLEREESLKRGKVGIISNSPLSQEKKKSRWKNFLVQMWGRRERDRIALARPSKDARVTSRPLFPSPHPTSYTYLLFLLFFYIFPRSIWAVSKEGKRGRKDSPLFIFSKRSVEVSNCIICLNQYTVRGKEGMKLTFFPTYATAALFSPFPISSGLVFLLLAL